MDVTLDKKSVNDDIDEAESKIESQFDGYINSLLSQPESERNKLLADLGPLLATHDVTILVRKQRSIGVYFFCKSNELLKQVKMFDMQVLKKVLQKIFTSLLKATKPVEFDTHHGFDETDYARCEKHLQRVTG